MLFTSHFKKHLQNWRPLLALFCLVNELRNKISFFILSSFDFLSNVVMGFTLSNILVDLLSVELPYPYTKTFINKDIHKLQSTYQCSSFKMITLCVKTRVQDIL